MTHIHSELRSRRSVAKTSKSERRSTTWPHAESALRAEAEAMLRDMAYVLHLTHTLKQTLENEQTNEEEPELVNV
jgi:hypothetical protein